mmetsp:Transcript_2628/g.7907  ORF Transcript_2628/g.7907 Transcript_2628/m.7907 type:complete len:201 (-) Transcript_2628:275-877(-)
MSNEASDRGVGGLSAARARLRSAASLCAAAKVRQVDGQRTAPTAGGTRMPRRRCRRYRRCRRCRHCRRPVRRAGAPPSALEPAQGGAGVGACLGGLPHAPLAVRLVARAAAERRRALRARQPPRLQHLRLLRPRRRRNLRTRLLPAGGHLQPFLRAQLRGHERRRADAHRGAGGRGGGRAPHDLVHRRQPARAREAEGPE